MFQSRTHSTPRSSSTDLVHDRVPSLTHCKLNPVQHAPDDLPPERMEPTSTGDQQAACRSTRAAYGMVSFTVRSSSIPPAHRHLTIASSFSAPTQGRWTPSLGSRQSFA